MNLANYDNINCTIKGESRMLYKVAICDDNEEDIEIVSKYLLKFSIESNMEITIDRFTSGEDLFAAYKKKQQQYDVVFLDMEMKELSGIDTAKKIRCLPDRNVLIVFITSYPEYMQDSFDVQASQYLIKPLIYEIFSEKLKKILYYLDELQTNIKVICMRHEEVILHLENIVCFETLKNPTLKGTLVITTIDGEIKIRGKIADFEIELKDKYFISVHRSILVNMKYIKRFNAQTLEFTTGKRVEISRRKISEVKEAFSKYKVMRYRK